MTSILVGAAAALVLANVATARGSPVWQGAHAMWLHRVVGFETPHRLGTFVNLVSGADGTASRRAASGGDDAGTFSYAFTPGVDGDFAYPAAHVAFLSGLSTEEQTWWMSWNDAVGSGPDGVPTAASEASTSSRVPSEAIVLLRGMDLEMKCVPGPNRTCNSEAIWPYHLDLGLTRAAGGTWGANISLARGWTPSHGGGKPLSTMMAYRLGVGVTVVRKPPVGAQVLRGRFASNTTVHSAPAAGQVTVGRRAQDGAVPGNATCAWVTTPSRIGFDLLTTKGRANRGRYIRSLDFTALDVTYSSRCDDTHVATVAAGVSSPPATTYAASQRAWVDFLTLSVPASSGARVHGPGYVNGTVCEDDKASAFYCHAHSLPSQLQGQTPLPPVRSPAL